MIPFFVFVRKFSWTFGPPHKPSLIIIMHVPVAISHHVILPAWILRDSEVQRVSLWESLSSDASNVFALKRSFVVVIEIDPTIYILWSEYDMVNWQRRRCKKSNWHSTWRYWSSGPLQAEKRGSISRWAFFDFFFAFPCWFCSTDRQVTSHSHKYQPEAGEALGRVAWY